MPGRLYPGLTTGSFNFSQLKHDFEISANTPPNQITWDLNRAIVSTSKIKFIKFGVAGLGWNTWILKT